MMISRAWESGRDVIGNYQVLRLLGRGGMGEVHLAWTGLRLVAIKVLNLQHANDSEFVEMFLSEARVAARINHTGIAQVLDVGMDGGRLYMVMEYVAGHTLDELLRDPAIPGLLPLRTLASMFAFVAHALATAHRAGVIHRDISPHNLLVSDTGAVKIIDFGIARTQTSDVHTSPGTFRGRFGYMAPEYVQGQPCDHRVDLFALGVVMWEAFARQRLYAGAAAAQLFTMLERPADRLDGILLGFPPALADMVARLLERDPEKRYASADQVADELSALVPTLADDGFRSLEHWVSHHLAARIEARAHTDRQELQRIAGVEAVQRLSAELGPELASESSASMTAVMTRTVTPLKVTFQGADEDPSIIVEHSGVGGMPVVAVDRRNERSGAMALPVAIDRRNERSGAVAMPMMASSSGPVMVGVGGVGAGGVGAGLGMVGAGGVGLGGVEASAGFPAPPPPVGWHRQMKATLSGRQGMLMVGVLAAMVVVLSVVLGLRGEMRARKGEWRARQAREEALKNGAQLELLERQKAEEKQPENKKPGEGAVAMAPQGAQGSSTTRESEGALGTGASEREEGSGIGIDPADGSASAVKQAQQDDEEPKSLASIAPKKDIALAGRSRSDNRKSGPRQLALSRQAPRKEIAGGGSAGPEAAPPGAAVGSSPSTGSGNGSGGTGATAGTAALGTSPAPAVSGNPPAAAGSSPSAAPVGPSPAPPASPTPGLSPPPTVKPAEPPAPPEPPPTWKVAEKAMGDEKRGRLALARCNACHKERSKAAFTGEEKTAGQWSRWFLAGRHKLPLGGRFSYGEMADAKAYLMSKSPDNSAPDQGAGIQ